MYSNQRVIGITLAVVAAAVLATVVALDGPVGSLVRDGTGTVNAIGVGVYWDTNCSDRVSVLDWGLVEPDSVENVTVFIRNEGNVAATLSLNTTNWNPSNASDFIALGWDYGGQVVDPNEVVEVLLFLSFSPSIEGISSFSFDVVVVGSG